MIAESTTKRLKWDFKNDVDLIRYKNVHTVCEESRCPNRYECSAHGVATYLIGGSECTRACKFCHIATAKPIALESIALKERQDILESAIARKYRYLVITSVARDDDELGLAEHFAQITRDLLDRSIQVELLVPDFHGRPEFLSLIGDASPTVIAHNMETIKRLSPHIRPQAKYERSLEFFRFWRERYPTILRKSGFMVGLGETREEVSALLKDMRDTQIEIVTVGQYMQPSHEQATVEKQYTSAEFADIENEVSALGFLACEVGPFVRSSYMAASTMAKISAEQMRRRNG
ncbi:MAG: lipoyl synthase [Spirochaetes bacterium]|nr:lipoyl synthase [Spirochaetota bacterium]